MKTRKDFHPDSVPVFIGVTGHRAIRNEEGDRDKLVRAIKRVVDEIRGSCRATNFILLTALAEGADQIAAETALEMGLEIAAILPMPKELYFSRNDDFSPEAVQNAERLLRLSKFVYTIPYEGMADDSNVQQSEFADVQFVETAHFISDHSHAVIALWDGILDRDASAGTGGAVRDSLHGVCYRYRTHDAISIPETRPVYHIYSPRPGAEKKKYDFRCRKLFPHPLLENGDKWFTIERYLASDGTPDDQLMDQAFAKRYFDVGADKEKEKAYRKQLSNIDRLNRRIDRDRLQSSLAAKKFAIRDEMSPRAELAKRKYAALDTLAIKSQRSRSLWGSAVIIMAGAAYSLMCVFNDLTQAPFVLIAYLAMMALTYIAFQYTTMRRFHDDYVDYRALAEGLRVQTYWYEACVANEGVPATVDSYYLTRQKGEIDWIRYALRNWNLLMMLGQDSARDIKDELGDEYDGNIFFDPGETSEATLTKVIDCWIGVNDVKYEQDSVIPSSDGPVIVKQGRYAAPREAIENGLGEEGQSRYFARAARKAERNGKSFKTIVSVLLGLDFIFVILVELGYATDIKLLNDNMNFLVYAAGALPVFAMVANEISSFFGYDVDPDRYHWYEFLYRRVLVELQAIDQAGLPEGVRIEKKQGKLLETGKEAMIENGDWTILSRGRAPHIPE